MKHVVSAGWYSCFSTMPLLKLPNQERLHRNYPAVFRCVVITGHPRKVSRKDILVIIYISCLSVVWQETVGRKLAYIMVVSVAYVFHILICTYEGAGIYSMFSKWPVIAETGIEIKIVVVGTFIGRWIGQSRILGSLFVFKLWRILLRSYSCNRTRKSHLCYLEFDWNTSKASKLTVTFAFSPFTSSDRSPSH